MSQMMVDEEELKARETEKAENDLRRPSIAGEDKVSSLVPLGEPMFLLKIAIFIN